MMIAEATWAGHRVMTVMIIITKAIGAVLQTEAEAQKLEEVAADQIQDAAIVFVVPVLQ